MAITDAYATATEYRFRTVKTDTAADAAIDRDLKAVSRFIDRRCGRTFNRTTALETRIYVPKRTSRQLWVDDIADSMDVTITVGGSVVSADRYRMKPLNAHTGSEPEPWTSFEWKLTTSRSRRLYGSRYLEDVWYRDEEIEVEAIWGYPAVPEGIVSATIELAGIWRLETPRATTEVNPDLNLVLSSSREANQIVGDMVGSYQRLWF